MESFVNKKNLRNKSEDRRQLKRSGKLLYRRGCTKKIIVWHINVISCRLQGKSTLRGS